MISPRKLPLPSFVANILHRLFVKCRLLAASHGVLYLPLNFITVPLAVILLLLAMGAVNGEDVKHGILGADGIQPISVMALFISLVY